jgi:hypothetical protein
VQYRCMDSVSFSTLGNKQTMVRVCCVHGCEFPTISLGYVGSLSFGYFLICHWFLHPTVIACGV